MPHTRDKARFQQRVDLLGGPKYLHLVNRVNGRRLLDTPHLGQQELQALLFTCLNSPSREHPWDLMPGRSFRELVDYFGWPSPHPDRLIIMTNTAARIAKSLLPGSRLFVDGSAEHSGVPGLRVEGCAARTIRLVHLPTGGLLELVDSRSHSAATIARDLDAELGYRADAEHSEGRNPMWEHSGVTPAETSAVQSRHRGPDAALLSALIARNQLFWRNDQDTALHSPRRSRCVGRLKWRQGDTAGEIGALLTGHSVGIPQARFEPPETEPGIAVLRVGSSQIELDGPWRPRRRLSSE
jgi:hypothetical protein